MHMGDALISPAVGGVMIVASTALIAYSVAKSKTITDEKKIPMMGVMGAFVFAAQMINFTIPITGSSGHIGGGMLLAAMLGGAPAFLTLATVLLIQAFFFADGGLLALGCNIFNMGFWPCLLVYPLLFKPLMKKDVTPFKLMWVSTLCVVIALQLGAFSVVLETLASGITSLPFSQFILLMQPIHLAIGIMEGIITGAVLYFVYKAKPEILEANLAAKTFTNMDIKKVAVGLLVAAIIVGGGLSLLASSNPDGLEWALFGNAENGYQAGLTTEEALDEEVYTKAHESAASLQENIAFLPDYAFKNSDSTAGTITSGIVGSIITLLLAVGIGSLIYLATKNKKSAPPTPADKNQ